MSNHEYFRELCALAAIGQLSTDEEHELGKHLFECASCREANAEYSHVVQHQLPRADPIRWPIKESVPKTPSDADSRESFPGSSPSGGGRTLARIRTHPAARAEVPVWSEVALATPSCLGRSRGDCGDGVHDPPAAGTESG